MMCRSFKISLILATVLLMACAGPAPTPEPGLKVLDHGRDREIQVAQDVDLSGDTKVILHNAQVEFRENWQRDKERSYGKEFREADMERLKNNVSDQFSKVMVKKLSSRDDYELTSESGPGVMHFIPRIVDLDIEAPGWMQNSIVESMARTKGSMTIEMVVRDSVSDELLAVAWQKQSDPQEGYMEITNTVNNTVAFRLMMQNWADWFLGQLDKA